ncbi:hypothetical protein L3Q82_004744 [Scortum barcoo]|uniref:Uncharacterized protein n=1 Tax=Scortum barcoo TaxID=214431 RepID=A0ACB8VI59_9TELE|nr:hypothetical protein L3Q82_004744 [Scortum barcoo]
MISVSPPFYIYRKSAEGVSHKFIIAVLMEYIRSLNQFQITVQHYLYELVIKTLVQHNLFYMLHQFLQYHVLSDSKPLACLLLSLESTYPPAHQLSLDMLKRLSTANDEIVEVLLSKQQVLGALRFIRSVGEDHDFMVDTGATYSCIKSTGTESLTIPYHHDAILDGKKHDDIGKIEAFMKPREDTYNPPIPVDLTYLVDGSCFRDATRNHAGCAVTQLNSDDTFTRSLPSEEKKKTDNRSHKSESELTETPFISCQSVVQHISRNIYDVKGPTSSYKDHQLGSLVQEKIFDTNCGCGLIPILLKPARTDSNSLLTSESAVYSVDSSTRSDTAASLLNPAALNDDYHPVALTPVIMKCFERIVPVKHIKDIIPAGLDQYQFAYRENRSTEDAVSIALHTAPDPSAAS